jgi:hypothetical protein
VTVSTALLALVVVVKMVLPVTITTAVPVVSASVVVEMTPPPGLSASASTVGEERVAGSTQAPLRRPTRPEAQQK